MLRCNGDTGRFSEAVVMGLRRYSELSAEGLMSPLGISWPAQRRDGQEMTTPCRQMVGARWALGCSHSPWEHRSWFAAHLLLQTGLSSLALNASCLDLHQPHKLVPVDPSFPPRTSTRFIHYFAQRKTHWYWYCLRLHLPIYLLGTFG